MSDQANSSVDPVWNEIYGEGRHLNKYPYDPVVSFVFRYAPAERAHSDISIVELGCGAGNNLWFAAREGFEVAGIDGSQAAIGFARRRFAAEGLEGDLRVGTFTDLPFDDASFDLAIDRGSITCVGRDDAARAVSEANRVLRPGGSFFSSPFSISHASYQSGREVGPGLIEDISAGALVGVGRICFYDKDAILRLFEHGWSLRELQHVETVDHVDPVRRQAEWRVVARKT